VLFESPNRLGATLVDLAAAMAQREAMIGRELTKVHEELLAGPLAELARVHAEREWLGEITMVIGPRPAGDEARVALAEENVLARIDDGLARGERPKDLAERLAVETGRPRRELYALAVQRRSR